MTELDQLRTAIATELSTLGDGIERASLSHDRLVAMLLLLDREHLQQIVSPPPVVSNPPTDAFPIPPSFPQYKLGVNRPNSSLIDWTFKPDKRGGRPTTIEGFQTAANLVDFNFHGTPDPAKAGKVYTGRGIADSSGQGYIDDLLVKNVRISTFNKWGARRNGLRRGNAFRNITVSNTDAIRYAEHAFYFGLAGFAALPAVNPWEELAIGFYGLDVFDIPAQGIQLVHRGMHKGNIETPGKLILADGGQLEAIIAALIVSGEIDEASEFLHDDRWSVLSDDDESLGGWIQLGDSEFHNVATWGDQGSYALSFFRTKNPLHVKDVLVYNRGRNSRGLLLVEDRPYSLIEGSKFHNGIGNRSIAKFETKTSTDVLRVRGCEFSAEGQRVDIKVNGFKDVVFEDNQGNGRLIVDGRDVGPISQRFVG